LKIGITGDPSASVFDSEGGVLGIGDAFSCGRGFFAKEFCEVPMVRAWSWRAVMGRESMTLRAWGRGVGLEEKDG
jgi:hypothetical protein